MLGCLPRDGLLVIPAEIVHPFVRIGKDYFVLAPGGIILLTLEVPETQQLLPVSARNSPFTIPRNIC